MPSRRVTLEFVFKWCRHFHLNTRASLKKRLCSEPINLLTITVLLYDVNK